MRKLAAIFAIFVLGACAGTSYGVSRDGTFPSRPDGAEYPNWEHLCVVFDSSNASNVLSESGPKGWELVGMGLQGSDSLICFKRPAAVSQGASE